MWPDWHETREGVGTGECVHNYILFFTILQTYDAGLLIIVFPILQT